MAANGLSGSTHYNQIYRDLVREQDDLIGMIAYAHYKQQKYECINDHWDKFGSAPTDDDLRKFHQIVSTPSSMSGYRRLAEDLLESYSFRLRDEITEEVDTQLRKQYEDSLEEMIRSGVSTADDLIQKHSALAQQQIRAAVREAQPGFLKTLWMNMICTLVIAFMTIMFTFFFFGSIKKFLTAMADKVNQIQELSPTGKK